MRRAAGRLLRRPSRHRDGGAEPARPPKDDATHRPVAIRLLQRWHLGESRPGRQLASWRSILTPIAAQARQRYLATGVNRSAVALLETPEHRVARQLAQRILADPSR